MENEEWLDISGETTHNYDADCPLCSHKFLIEQKCIDGTLSKEILNHIIQYAHVANCYDAYVARKEFAGEIYRINCEIIGNKECRLFKKTN